MKNPLATYLFLGLLLRTSSALNGVWRWECKNGYCEKARITPETEATAISLAACRLLCSEAGALWPKPTGDIHIGTTLVKVNLNSINSGGIPSETAAHGLSKDMMKRFTKQLEDVRPNTARIVDGGKTIDVVFEVTDRLVADIDLDIDESYKLLVTEGSDGHLTVTITADNIFGARHGLETWNQLIVYDDLRDEYIAPNAVNVTDKPAYTWRGILLDTSRNYISVEAIKRTINAMGASKLNSFHWHITDTHSFPFTAESLPDLQKLGAYTPQKIYSTQDVADVIALGRTNGVRVIPEFDAPAHVGEGWQDTDFVACFNAKPWQNYCVEPPCGQFDPTKDQLYDALESLYGDMIKQFQPPVFHMGGDEVHFGCWNSTASIVDWMQKEQGWGTSDADFVKLWDVFQNQSLARLYKVAGRQIPAIMWTSTLTKPEFLHYLPKEQYIIQIWTERDDPQISNLLDNGYRVILSNYDALYLDCGFSGWVDGGHNWCSPYKGWQTVYENKPAGIAGGKKDLVLGAEAALWVEQVDSANVDSRLWPRAAALGEVLWSEPTTSWRQAEARFLVQRERLVNLGVDADALEPEWCRQYEESCPLDGFHNGGGSVPEPQEPPTPEPDNTGSGTANSITAIVVIVNLMAAFF